MINEGEFCVIGGPLLSFIIDQSLVTDPLSRPTFYKWVDVNPPREEFYDLNGLLNLRVQVIPFEGQMWKEC